MEVNHRQSLSRMKLLLSAALLIQATTACFNYVCSEDFKKCTKKGGDNVYVNSNACDSNIYLSEGILSLFDL